MQKKLGQYFTTNIILKEKIYNFIQNNPLNILEPAVGRGDLVEYILSKKTSPEIKFDMYEIDKKIEPLSAIKKDDIYYCDFLNADITKKYATIIGNPPYIKHKTGNLYIKFVEKCCNLLEDNGELIFIVPSDFFKLTSASRVLEDMLATGTITHVFYPNDEQMFDNAAIDILIFRYCKNINLPKKVLFNDTEMSLINSNGLITFEETELILSKKMKDYFNIYVGLVSGKEEVYKNEELGNIDVLNSEDKIDRYIFIKEFPTDNNELNKHLLTHKSALMNRGIRNFDEENWFEFGAARNMETIENHMGQDCLYIYTITRKTDVAFKGDVNYFGGNLIIMIPKSDIDLDKFKDYLNSTQFKKNFLFSNRFKIGQRQLSNSYVPDFLFNSV